MPPPKVFPCGTPGNPPCPPEPCVATVDETATYTARDMAMHGQACFAAGLNTAQQAVHNAPIWREDSARKDHVIAEIEKLIKE